MGGSSFPYRRFSCHEAIVSCFLFSHPGRRVGRRRRVVLSPAPCTRPPLRRRSTPSRRMNSPFPIGPLSRRCCRPWSASNRAPSTPSKPSNPKRSRRTRRRNSRRRPKSLRKFFDQMQPGDERRRRRGDGTLGFGSGFIVDPKGVVMTNFHVVDGADEVTVELNDGRKFVSKDIKSDPKTDLAIVRIHAKGPAALPGVRRQRCDGDRRSRAGGRGAVRADGHRHARASSAPRAAICT